MRNGLAVADRPERKRSRGGDLRISISQCSNQRRKSALWIDLCERGRGLKPKVCGALAQTDSERFETIWMTDRAQGDRGILSNNGYTIVQALDEYRNRSRIAEIAERRARFRAHLGTIVLE